MNVLRERQWVDREEIELNNDASINDFRIPELEKQATTLIKPTYIIPYSKQNTHKTLI